jgi:CheY-like chemotaxis protein
MPVMSGDQFLTTLRATEGLATIPVVIVSAWPREATALLGAAQGYVRKPVALEVLLDAVQRFCAGQAIRPR